MNREETNWSRVAAWVFGIWSIMLPISAGIVSYYQNQIATNTNEYRKELVTLRLEVMQTNMDQNSQITGILARQMEVVRRLEIIERTHLR
jgi:hypothetical protein